MGRSDGGDELPAALASRRGFLQAAAIAGAAASGWELLWPGPARAESPRGDEGPLAQKVLMGIAGSKGDAEGEALVSKQPLSWAPLAISNETGIIRPLDHELTGRSVKDKIVIYPTVCGSMAGSMGLFFKVKVTMVGPRAIICRNLHAIDVGGAVAAGIPAVEGLSEDPLYVIQTGDWVEIRAERIGKPATVTITRKVERRNLL